MFDQTEIRFNIGRAMFWLTLTTGICVLVVNLFTYRPGLGLLGLALLMASCGIATRRAISDHDRAMHAAFELGRDHERSKRVRSLT